MTSEKKTLIKWYLLAILVVVFFVPWVNVRVHSDFYGYHSLFSPPDEPAVIDYGRIVLELIAITAIAGLLWLFQEQVERFFRESVGKLMEIPVQFKQSERVYKFRNTIGIILLILGGASFVLGFLWGVFVESPSETMGRMIVFSFYCMIGGGIIIPGTKSQ